MATTSVWWLLSSCIRDSPLCKGINVLYVTEYVVETRNILLKWIKQADHFTKWQSCFYYFLLIYFILYVSWGLGVNFFQFSLQITHCDQVKGGTVDYIIRPSLLNSQQKEVDDLQFLNVLHYSRSLTPPTTRAVKLNGVSLSSRAEICDSCMTEAMAERMTHCSLATNKEINLKLKQHCNSIFFSSWVSSLYPCAQHKASMKSMWGWLVFACVISCFS